MPAISWRVYATAGAMAAAFAAAWFIQSQRWDNDVLTMRNQYAADQLVIAKANQAALSDAIIARDESQENAAKLSRQLNERIANEKSNNKRIADAVANGTMRLLVSGKSVTTGGSVSVPGTGGAGSAGDVVQFQLSESSQRAYYALRDSITTDREMIDYFKGYINEQCYVRGKP